MCAKGLHFSAFITLVTVCVFVRSDKHNTCTYTCMYMYIYIYILTYVYLPSRVGNIGPSFARQLVQSYLHVHVPTKQIHLLLNCFFLLIMSLLFAVAVQLSQLVLPSHVTVVLKILGLLITAQHLQK